MMHLKEENLVINKKLVFFLISILLLVSFCSIFFIENHSLVAHDESLYANRAKLIIDSNNWFTPFEEAHHKTIGSYWLIALSFKIFGISELDNKNLVCDGLLILYSADLILNFNKFLTKFHPVPFIEISMNEGGGDKTKNSSLLS